MVMDRYNFSAHLLRFCGLCRGKRRDKIKVFASLIPSAGSILASLKFWKKTPGMTPPHTHDDHLPRFYLLFVDQWHHNPITLRC